MAGYQRQATANIQPDLVIDAADLNSEYNALANAFNASTGHKHDGSPGEGAKISLTSAVSGILPVLNGGTGSTTAAGARTSLDAQQRLDSVASFELAGNLTGDRYTFIDFHSTDDPSQSDNSTRIARTPGVNGPLIISNRGSGGIALDPGGGPLYVQAGGSPIITASNIVTTSVNGLMIAADKLKLDGIAAGAQVNPGVVTTWVDGLMPYLDKRKLDAIETGLIISDFSDVQIPNGFYTWSPSSLNIPAGLQSYGTAIITGFPGGGGANHRARILFELSSDKIYIQRSVNMAAWTNMVQLYHTGNILGTVSQSGGVPTGAIIERGSNANGEYVRFADGTQICWIDTVVTDQAIDSAYGSLFVGSRIWSYPAAFITTPNVTCGQFKWGNGASWGTVQSSLGATAILRGVDTESRSVGTNVAISATAKGRWF